MPAAPPFLLSQSLLNNSQAPKDMHHLTEITLLDYFAGQALASAIINPTAKPAEVAVACYKLAKAMVAEAAKHAAPPATAEAPKKPIAEAGAPGSPAPAHSDTAAASGSLGRVGLVVAGTYEGTPPAPVSFATAAASASPERVGLVVVVVGTDEATAPAPVVHRATAAQSEDIIRLLNSPMVTRPEKTKMLLNINRLDTERAAQAIAKLTAAIAEREAAFPNRAATVPPTRPEAARVLHDLIVDNQAALPENMISEGLALCETATTAPEALVAEAERVASYLAI